MDNFLRYVLAAGLGAAGYAWYKQNQEEKSTANPEDEIEAELERRSQLDYKPSFTNYNFNRSDD